MTLAAAGPAVRDCSGSVVVLIPRGHCEACDVAERYRSGSVVARVQCKALGQKCAAKLHCLSCAGDKQMVVYIYRFCRIRGAYGNTCD